MAIHTSCHIYFYSSKNFKIYHISFFNLINLSQFKLITRELKLHIKKKLKLNKGLKLSNFFQIFKYLGKFSEDPHNYTTPNGREKLNFSTSPFITLMKQGFAYLKSSRMMYSRRTRMIMILKKPLLKIPTQNNFLYFLGHTLFLVCRREKKREFVFLFVFYREIFTAHFCFWRQILMTSKICKSALK